MVYCPAPPKLVVGAGATAPAGSAMFASVNDDALAKPGSCAQVVGCGVGVGLGASVAVAVGAPGVAVALLAVPPELHPARARTPTSASMPSDRPMRRLCQRSHCTIANISQSPSKLFHLRLRAPSGWRASALLASIGISSGRASIYRTVCAGVWRASHRAGRRGMLGGDIRPRDEIDAEVI